MRARRGSRDLTVGCGLGAGGFGCRPLRLWLRAVFCWGGRECLDLTVATDCRALVAVVAALKELSSRASGACEMLASRKPASASSSSCTCPSSWTVILRCLYHVTFALVRHVHESGHTDPAP